MKAAWLSISSWWQANLRRQLVIPVILIAILGLVVSGTIVIEAARKLLERQVINHSTKLARFGADQMNTLFQDMINLSRLQQQQMLNPNDPFGQEQALLSLQQSFPDIYISLQLLDGDGDTMLALDRDRSATVGTVQRFVPAQRLPRTPEIDAAVRNQQLYVSPVGYQSITSTPYVTVVIPLITSTREGSLIIEVDARFFWKRVDLLQIDHGSAMIVDDQGTILAHPDRQRVGQKVSPALLEIVRQPGAASVTVQDSESLATYAPLSDTIHWGMLIEQNREAVLAPIGQITTAMIGITLVSAMLMGLLLSVLIRRTLRPVGRLSEQAAHIAASGDFSHDLSIGRHDELGVLADTLNHMLYKLRESHTQVQQLNQGLEQQVADRTAALQSALEEIEERSRHQNELLSLIQRLSMPIIPIMDEIVIVPLVGEITPERTIELRSTLLLAIQQEKVRVAIIDITGVPIIDSQIARTFIDVAYGARLMGAVVIIAGIRPEIAQVLVSATIGLGDLHTSATLDQAFTAARKFVLSSQKPSAHR